MKLAPGSEILGNDQTKCVFTNLCYSSMMSMVNRTIQMNEYLFHYCICVFSTQCLY